MDAQTQDLIKKLAQKMAGTSLDDMLAPGSNSPLAALIGMVVQESLKQEMTEHLGHQPYQRTDSPKTNSRNGFYSKTIKTTQGPVDIEVPRDRNGEFEPIIVTKGQRVAHELEERILALLNQGMSNRQIQEHVEGIYHTKLSPSAISTLAKTLDVKLKAWRSRPLEQVYAIVIIDAIYVKVRHTTGIKPTPVYQVTAYDDAGRLEILGVYLDKDGQAKENATFWHSVFVDLQNRGLNDILYLCVDGLPGVPKAAQGIWPQVQIQPCVVHLVRNSFKKVASKDQKILAGDLRDIYQAVNFEAAELALEQLRQNWGESHKVVIQWEKNLIDLSGLFEVTQALRKKISTTNAIENVHSQQRRWLKAHKMFPSHESALRKMTMIARKISNKSKSKGRGRRNWRQVVNDIQTKFEDRLPDGWGESP